MHGIAGASLELYYSVFCCLQDLVWSLSDLSSENVKSVLEMVVNLGLNAKDPADTTLVKLIDRFFTSVNLNKITGTNFKFITYILRN